MSKDGRFFFAGGGTGGHLYPALAVADRLQTLAPDAHIHFLCSHRAIDAQILNATGYAFTPLPALGLSWRPRQLIRFVRSFAASARLARGPLTQAGRAVVVGVGGFASSPVCWTAHRLGIPIALINVDSVPGKANKLNVRWAWEVFVHFEGTVDFFRRFDAQVRITGCPLRSGFAAPDAGRARTVLGLDPQKFTLLITGASSGCRSINEAVQVLLPWLNAFAHTWQIVHLTGTRNYEEIARAMPAGEISYQPVAYYDQMPDLLAAADLVIGRSGAVSVAEYAAAGVPAICVPYPHHKDRHQYRNADKLIQAGAAIMVDDLPDLTERAEWLWEELEPLLKDSDVRAAMSAACQKIARPDAAQTIARRLLDMV